MKLPYNIYYKKLTACYIGKAIGGTLGMPYEGKIETNNITYYNPYPTEMCGNDDLDLQVVSLEAIYKEGLPINRHHLSAAWDHMNFGPDEYSVALHNIRNHLYAPLSGSYSNKFGDGMGAAIRSEIWASLAPANPSLAVSFAKEDACADHHGNGIDASVFLTALESAAYIESDKHKLISTALSYISAESKLYSAITDTVAWWNEEKSLFGVREKILSKYYVENWSDCVINVGFVILAWLAGEDDFGKSICYAVNCGYDADCTAATLGALLGIISPDGIDSKWTEPIGNKLILSPQILGLCPSDTVVNFCDKIAELMSAVSEYYSAESTVSGIPENIALHKNLPEPWLKRSDILPLYAPGKNESIISTSPLLLILNYPENIALECGKEEQFTLTVINPTETRLSAKLKIDLPRLFTASEADFEFSLEAYEKTEIEFSIISGTSFKTAEETIRFNFKLNGLSFSAFAGLITSFPWIEIPYENGVLCEDKAIKKPVSGFVQSLTPGRKRLLIDMHPAMPQQVAVTCQGTRPLKLYINDDLVLNYDAKHYIPAVHRGYSILAELNSKWNKIVIELEDGGGGELFFAIGNHIDWIWFNRAEWREALK